MERKNSPLFDKTGHSLEYRRLINFIRNTRNELFYLTFPCNFYVFLQNQHGFSETVHPLNLGSEITVSKQGIYHFYL